MVFKKQSDFLDELPINSRELREGAPRRSFNLEDLQNLDPHCRETVSIDLGAGPFEPAATFESLEPTLHPSVDMRGQTLIQTQEFSRPQTLIRDGFKNKRKAGLIGILTIGIAGGFVIALSIMYSQNSKKTPAHAVAVAAVAPDILTESPIQELQPDMFTVPQNEMQQKISVQESIVIPESGIAEYARSQPVQIAPRQFLYATGTQRTFGTSLAAPEYVPDTKNSKGAVTARSLKKAGSDGQYQNRADGTQWQGDWKLNSPASNISKAESFGSYAQSKGANSLDSLRVIQQPKSSLLTSTNGAVLTPKLSK